MYLDKLNEIVVEIFKEMLENGEIPAVEGGEFSLNDKGSGAVLYSDGDKVTLYINNTDNMSAEEAGLSSGKEDVYIGVEAINPEYYDAHTVIAFNFPEKDYIKGIIKEVYSKFYKVNEKNESVAQKLNNELKRFED